MIAPAGGLSMVTAVVKAAAEAAWPDGKDEEVGGSGTVRKSGRASAAGRRRGSSGLAIRVAGRLGPAMASPPRSAGPRGGRRRAGRGGAPPAHRAPRVAGAGGAPRGPARR